MRSDLHYWTRPKVPLLQVIPLSEIGELPSACSDGASPWREKQCAFSGGAPVNSSPPGIVEPGSIPESPSRRPIDTRLMYVHSANANVEYVESPLSPGEKPRTECMCGVLGESPVSVSVNLSIDWEQQLQKDQKKRALKYGKLVDEETGTRPRFAQLARQASCEEWALWQGELVWLKAVHNLWANKSVGLAKGPTSVWRLCATLSAIATLMVLFM